MPRSKSVAKALQASQQKKMYNLRTKKKYKAAIKVVRKATAKKSADLALEALPKAYKQLDLAAKKRVIHKNKAARLKSRLARAASKLVSKKKVKSKPVKKTTTKKGKKK